MRNGKLRNISWTLIICYLLLVSFGWVNIYASIYNEDTVKILDFSQRYGTQLIWILSAILIAVFILFVIDPKVYSVFPWFFYGVIILLLIAVLVFGREINGAKSWLSFGAFSIQPAELSKITTSLCMAAIMSRFGFKITSLNELGKVILTLLIPMGLIMLEPETGTIIVYIGFIFVLFREGLSGWLLTFGILIIALFILTLKFTAFEAIMFLLVALGVVGCIYSRHTFKNLLKFFGSVIPLCFIPALLRWDPIESVNGIAAEYWLLILLMPALIYILIQAYKQRNVLLRYIGLCYIASIILIFSVEVIFDHILQDHQRSRIEVLLGIKEDPKGTGYNVNQSMIAIGSGGFSGKGFLNGTQTKFNFVPEQTTDFIFCTVGEEWGFLGCSAVLLLFFILIATILSRAEKSESAFTRIYGYSIASLFFMHVFINVGMTIGLVPVIGIPLPFLSYGGSSMWTFTILLFIFIRLDMDR